MRIDRSTWAVSTLFILAAVATGCGGGDSATAPKGPTPPKKTQAAVPKGDPIAGQQKFLKTCVTCHGPAGLGLPKLGKNLVTSEWAKSKTDAELVAFLKVGRPALDPLNTTKVDMPPKGGNPSLTEKDLADIVAFVRMLQRG